MTPRGQFTAADRAAFSTVESPYKGADLLRKLMEIARNAGHFRRYFSLRRAWLRATNDTPTT